MKKLNKPVIRMGLVISVLMPGLLQGEGALRVLDCNKVLVCDESLTCQTESGQVVFNMEPLNLDENNAGSYTIRYDAVQVPMQGLSFAGPFHWRLDNGMHTLLASSESDFLWHSLTIDPQPVTTIRKLDCRFMQ